MLCPTTNDSVASLATAKCATWAGIHPLPVPVMRHQPSLWRIHNRELEASTDIRAILAADEIQRARRIRDKTHARDFAVSRAALRLILGELTGREPASLSFVTNPFGKPYLANPESPLCFNLSHASPWTLIAVIPGCSIGVDIEEYDFDLNPLETGSVVLTRQELLKLGSLHGPLRYRMFYRLWTAKEAVLKMLGVGFSMHPQQIDVLDALHGNKQVSVSLPDERAIATRYELSPLNIADGYAAAVAVGSGFSKPASFRENMSETNPRLNNG